MASLQRIQNNTSDSEGQGDRASPKTFIFLSALVWQNFTGGTNSTEPLPKMYLHTFSRRAFVPPIVGFPAALKARSGDGEIEYDWSKGCVYDT